MPQSTQSHCSDTSSHNSITDHLVTSSSACTTSSLSDDQPCSSSDDAGSLTSSETYRFVFKFYARYDNASFQFRSFGRRPCVLDNWHGTDSISSISSVRKEQEKLAEDRRLLELDQLKLQQECERLSREKEKLEQDKKKQQQTEAGPSVAVLPPQIKPFMMPTHPGLLPSSSSSMNFLKELKEKSTAREQRSLEGSSNTSSLMGSPREFNGTRISDSEGENVSGDYRKRHGKFSRASISWSGRFFRFPCSFFAEKLMDEFREAHKKMFLSPNSESDESVGNEVTLKSEVRI